VTDAWPEEFVVAVPAPLADAPENGAVKVTVAPETGLLKESFTKATSGLVKLVPTWADCGEPELTTKLAGHDSALNPATNLARVKLDHWQSEKAIAVG